MTKLARMIVLAAALVAILGGAVGDSRSVEAANGYEMWYGPFDDGCHYYWDGFDYTIGGCPQRDGSVNFYVGDGRGGWVYVLSVGSLSDGGTWTYYNGIYYYNTVSDGYVNGLYQTSMTLGGANYSLTNQVVANQFNIDLTTNSNAIWLAPDCKEVYNNICYY